MKYLLFSGSLRTDSLNKKLVGAAQSFLSARPQTECKVADLKSFDIPVYDGDIELAGIPEGVKHLGTQIQNTQALIISSPEYNNSIAGSLKNTIDWISRLRPVPLTGKAMLLMGASPGAFGGIRGLSATRIPLEALGAYIFPQTFALPEAHEAFAKDGALVDANTHKKFTDLLLQFELFAKRLI